MIPFAVLVLISLFVFRMINHFAGEIPGFIGYLMCLFLNGLGVVILHSNEDSDSTTHAALFRWRSHWDHVQGISWSSCTLEALRAWLRLIGGACLPLTNDLLTS